MWSPKAGPGDGAKTPQGFWNLFPPCCPPWSKLEKSATISEGSGVLPLTPPGQRKTGAPQGSSLLPGIGEGSCRPSPHCNQGRPLHPRYLISLGADQDAANDDGDLPSDLIDPDFKDLVELFKGTRVA